jgi:anti-sigma B factor antagonist
MLFRHERAIVGQSQESRPMEITPFFDDAGVRRVSISGRIVQNDLDEKRAALDRLLGPGESAHPLLLDLSAADFIDSSGLSWLLVWHKRYNGANSKLVLHSIPPTILDVLRMMRLDMVFHIAADEKAAREVVQGAA